MVMILAVTYTPCATSLREQTGNMITFTQFEEGSILTKTRNYAEIDDDDSIMLPLLSKEDMDPIDSGDESDHDIISTEMLEENHDGCKSHPNVNRIEECYKVCDIIKQRQLEWKRAFKTM